MKFDDDKQNVRSNNVGLAGRPRMRSMELLNMRKGTEKTSKPHRSYLKVQTPTVNLTMGVVGLAHKWIASWDLSPLNAGWNLWLEAKKEKVNEEQSLDITAPTESPSTSDLGIPRNVSYLFLTWVRYVIPVRRIEFIFSLQDLFKQLGIVLIVKWGIAAQSEIKEGVGDRACVTIKFRGPYCRQGEYRLGNRWNSEEEK